MSLVADLMTVHAEALQELQGDRYLYRRDADGQEAMLALVRGKTDHESRTPDGAVVTVRSEDWLVGVDEFQLMFGEGTVPEHDDKIFAPAAPPSGPAHVYRVKPLDGEGCYRTQPGGLMFRIHTKDDGRA